MTRTRRPAGWAIAATGAVVAHSAVAMVLMRPAVPADAPRPALIIEMVPAAPAPPPPGFTVPESGLPAVEPLVTRRKPAEPEPEPPEPEPEPEPEPPPPEPEPQPEPPVEAPPPEPVVLPGLPPLAPPTPEQFEDVAAPLPSPPPEEETQVEPAEEPVLATSARPQRKPDPPPKPREEPRQAQREPQRERPRQDTPREAARQPQATAPQSGAAGQEQPRRQSAAPTSGAGRAISPQAIRSWESQVQQAVARHMSRTRVSSRQALSATLAVRVDGGGRVAGVSLAGGSGDARVDGALSAQARRLPRLPATPDGRARDLVVPFRITR